MLLIAPLALEGCNCHFIKCQLHLVNTKGAKGCHIDHLAIYNKHKLRVIEQLQNNFIKKC